MSQQRIVTGGRVVPILMPEAGNTMEEGTVALWRVREGDRIEAGQLICEIETDKATIDYESPAAGRLARIVAKQGEPVPVKALIALLAESDVDAEAYLAGHRQQGAGSGEQLAGSEKREAPSVGAGGSQIVEAPEDGLHGRVKASPAARMLAAETGVNLAALGAGSGPGGRILSTDVARQRGASPCSAVQREEQTTETKMGTEPGQGNRRPMSKMRRAIGSNLQRSKQTIPHFYMRLTVNADPLLAFYRARKSTAGCTLNDIVVLAVGRVIGELPAVRSQIVGDDVVEYPHANIGVAVGVDDGLVVPVVMDVDTLSLAQLALETKRVVEGARKGRLENVGKGNFTISNLGMFGIEEFSAIINPPESGILAVGAVREAVLVENGAMRPGRVMTMTLSADHRVVDGVLAATFMARLKKLLENPERELA